MLNSPKSENFTKSNVPGRFPSAPFTVLALVACLVLAQVHCSAADSLGAFVRLLRDAQSPAGQSAATATKTVILLHGYGSNEQDLFSFASQFPISTRVISLRAPNVLATGRYAWFAVQFHGNTRSYDTSQYEQSLNLLIKAVEQIRSSFAKASSKVYLCGFSQGAIMSYGLALRRPDLVQGVMALSGRLLEESRMKPSSGSARALLSSVPVFIAHGRKDPVIAIDEARKAKTYLSSLSIPCSFHEYNAVHEIKEETLRDMLNWFKEH